MAFGAQIFGRFILFAKSHIRQFLIVLWPVHGVCVWPVYGQFLGSSEAEFVALLWHVCCVDMLDCVLIYVDICLLRYIDMDGCKLYTIDIIIHDTEYKIWYLNVSYNINYACDMI